MSIEIRRSVSKVEADIQLLRRVAAVLAVRHGDTALAARVDALGDELNEQWCQAVYPDLPGSTVRTSGVVETL